MLFALGQQPTVINVWSAHIRGYTRPALRGYVEASGDFRLIQVGGSGFYPFPPPLSKPWARFLPSLAVFTIFLFQKQQHTNCGYWEQHYQDVSLPEHW